MGLLADEPILPDDHKSERQLTAGCFPKRDRPLPAPMSTFDAALPGEPTHGSSPLLPSVAPRVGCDVGERLATFLSRCFDIIGHGRGFEINDLGRLGGSDSADIRSRPWRWLSEKFPIRGSAATWVSRQDRSFSRVPFIGVILIRLRLPPDESRQVRRTAILG